ncbi:hypothetical protein RRG08_013813 [Elysia crispata]|uniref:Uncharacterized protein n=1 Tax=Elysia crispata TaxID=231223 RepID=A0AAE1BCA9_9GAST|nr:hypothetical protein RRG08_013813 [Elysia crispata]
MSPEVQEAASALLSENTGISGVGSQQEYKKQQEHYCRITQEPVESTRSSQGALVGYTETSGIRCQQEYKKQLVHYCRITQEPVEYDISRSTRRS